MEFSRLFPPYLALIDNYLVILRRFTIFIRSCHYNTHLICSMMRGLGGAKPAGRWSKVMEAKCPLVPKYPREMVDGTDITANKFEGHGFDTPLVVKEDGKKNLGLIVPNEKTTLQDVANVVGQDVS